MRSTPTPRATTTRPAATRRSAPTRRATKTPPAAHMPWSARATPWCWVVQGNFSPEKPQFCPRPTSRLSGSIAGATIETVGHVCDTADLRVLEAQSTEGNLSFGSQTTSVTARLDVYVPCTAFSWAAASSSFGSNLRIPYCGGQSANGRAESVCRGFCTGVAYSSGFF